jgi:hypothetical protein
MMNKFLEGQKLLTIFYVIVAIMILYSAYVSSKREDYLKQNYGFTIAKAFEYSGTGGNKGYVDYKYFVDSIKYIGEVRRNYEMDSPLEKYYKVKYSKVKPEISEMYLTEEIIDSAEIVKAGFKYKKK